MRIFLYLFCCSIFFTSFCFSSLLKPNVLEENASHSGSIGYHQKNIDTLPAFFQKVFDITPENDIPRDIKKTPDGGFILVGASGNFASVLPLREGFILKTDSLGTVEWCKILGVDSPLPPPTPDIEEMFENVVVTNDSSYLVAGTRNHYQQGINRPFLLKFNNNGELLWALDIIPPVGWRGRTYNLQTLDNGNVLMIGEFYENWLKRAFIIEFTTTGILVWGKQYLSGDHIIELKGPFEKTSDKDYRIFCQLVKRQPWKSYVSIMDMDSIGNFKWMKNYTYYTGGYDGLDLGRQLPWVKTANGYLVGAWLGYRNTNDLVRRATLLKIDTSGTLQWAKTYRDTVPRIVEGIDYIQQKENGNYALSFTDSYLWSQESDGLGLTDPDESVVIGEINEEGDLQWVRRYGGNGKEDYSRIEMLDDDNLLIATKSESFNTGGQAVYLLKTDENGYAGECNQAPIEIITEDLAVTQDTFTLEAIPFENVQTFTIPIWDATLGVQQLCPVGLPNLIVKKMRQFPLCIDSLKIEVKVCNSGLSSIASGIPITFYDSDPTQDEANVLLMETIPSVIFPSTCQTIIAAFPLPSSVKTYIVVNDSGNYDLPYDLTTALSQSSIQESNYTDNLGSLEFFIPEDVYIILDTMACQGDTLVFNGVPVAAGTNHEFIYQSFTGCDSIVNVTVEAISPILVELEMSICQGDSLFIFGNYVHQAGVYEHKFTSFFGCDSIHRVSLSLLPLPSFTLEGGFACHDAQNGWATVVTSGDSHSFLWSTGQTDSLITNLLPGNYHVTVTNIFGCSKEDSIYVGEHSSLEIQLDTIISASNFNTADGAIIFEQIIGGTPPYTYLWSNGTTEQNLQNVMPGNYSLTITDANECIKEFSFFIDGQTFSGQSIKRDFSAVIIPNPTKKEQQKNRLELYSPFSQVIRFQLFDMTGQMVIEHTLSLNKGNNEFLITPPKVAGVYWAILKSEGEGTVVIKWIVL